MPDTRVTLSLRLEPRVLERLRAAADDRGMSANRLAVALIDEALPHLRPVSEFTVTTLKPAHLGDS